MGMLFDLLPLMKNWEWVMVDVEDENIAPGSTFDVIFEEKEVGWVLASNITMIGEGVENTKINLKVDKVDINETPLELYRGGYTQRGLSWIYLNRYDLVDNVCSVELDFPFPIPYNSLLKVSVSSPSGHQITIDTASIWRARVKTNRLGKFKEQLKNLLGTSAIEKFPIGEKGEFLEMEGSK